MKSTIDLVKRLIEMKRYPNVRLHTEDSQTLQDAITALTNAEQAKPVPQSEIAQSFSEYWLTIISDDPSHQEVFEAGWKAGYKHGAWSAVPTGEQK